MKFKNLKDWKQRENEKKRIAKSATLRKYAKLCKAEGIQSDRVNLGVRTDRDRDANAIPKSKTPKVDKTKISQLEHIQLRREEEKQESIKAIEESLRKRKEKQKIMTKKTKKGQPVMAGRILNILEKLNKDA